MRVPCGGGQGGGCIRIPDADAWPTQHFRVNQGLAILLSEQNARMSLAIADRAYVIEMGRVVMQGRGEDLLGKAEIAERYLGVGAAVDRAHADARHAALVQGLERILRG